MNYSINGITRKSLSGDRNPPLSLDQYLHLARRMIGKFAPPEHKDSMLNSEDAIDIVATTIMFGDCSFNPTLGFKETTWRGINGKYGIKTYLKNINLSLKKSNWSIDSEESQCLKLVCDAKAEMPYEQMVSSENACEARKTLRPLLLGLTKKQKNILNLVHIEGMSCLDIAKQYGCRVSSIKNSITKAENKMKQNAGTI